MKTYTISELAREFQVTPRALRFNEDKGLLSPTRDGLNRVYSTRDRARLKLILQGKSVGFSLSDIRLILDLYTLEGHRAQLKLSLKKSRDQIKNLEKQREDIEAALDTLHKGVKVIFEDETTKTKSVFEHAEGLVAYQKKIVGDPHAKPVHDPPFTGVHAHPHGHRVRTHGHAHGEDLHHHHHA